MRLLKCVAPVLQSEAETFVFHDEFRVSYAGNCSPGAGDFYYRTLMVFGFSGRIQDHRKHLRSCRNFCKNWKFLDFVVLDTEIIVPIPHSAESALECDIVTIRVSEMEIYLNHHS